MIEQAHVLHSQEIDRQVVEHRALSKADELNSAGAKLHRDGNIGHAYFHFLAALTVDCHHVEAWQNLSAALIVMEKYESAEVAARRALSYAPENPFVKSNLGISLVGQRRFAEAQTILEEVLSNDAVIRAPHIWHNYGLSLYMREEFAAAAMAFARSLDIDSTVSIVKSDFALSQLALAMIQNGLQAYEIRWDILYKSKIWDYNIAEWQGQPLRGKKILLHHEQGFGDSLMLSRFIPYVRGLGGEVTLAVPQELIRLMELSFGVAKVFDWNDPALASGQFDYHSPLLSVMRHVGISEPKQISSSRYLMPAASGLLLPKASVKIGLCWASGDHGRALTRRRRVIGLEKFLPLAALPGVLLVSLQKGASQHDIENAGALGIVYDALAKVDDFAGTAEVIEQLDLVISVDSAVAHLAGALGKPCLMLSPWPRCWRWWGANGSPWYENMQIFQQEPSGSWASAVDSVVKTAETFVSDLEYRRLAAQ